MRSPSPLKLEKSASATLSAPSLVAAAPFEALLAALTRDIAYIKDRLPGSSEIALLQRHRDELARALDEAHRADVWLTPKEVKAHTGKGLSTITKDCRDFEAVAGATRKGKRGWLIHWPTYEAWMRTTGREKKAA